MVDLQISGLRLAAHGEVDSGVEGTGGAALHRTSLKRDHEFAQLHGKWGEIIGIDHRPSLELVVLSDAVGKTLTLHNDRSSLEPP